MKILSVTYTSKWGYHPVSYSDYLFLRQVHKRYWSSLYQAYKWQRWIRKLPKNRKGPEPITDPTFIQKGNGSKDMDWFQTYSGIKSRTHYLLFKRLYKDIVTDFLNARIPNKTPEACTPVDMSKYESLRTHL